MTPRRQRQWPKKLQIQWTLPGQTGSSRLQFRTPLLLYFSTFQAGCSSFVFAPPALVGHLCLAQIFLPLFISLLLLLYCYPSERRKKLDFIKSFHCSHPHEENLTLENIPCLNIIFEKSSSPNYFEVGTFHSLGTVSRGKTAVLLDFVQITFPQFGQLVQLFSDVEIQDLKVSLGLKILYILYKFNLKKV